MRVLARRDRFDRFVSGPGLSCRASASSDVVRIAIGEYPGQDLQGPRQRRSIRSSPEGPLVRMHFIIGRAGGETPRTRIAPTLEEGVAAIVRTWTDALERCAVESARRRRRRAQLFERYRQRAFSAGYREGYSPADCASTDIRTIEGAVGGAAAQRRFLSPRPGREACASA